MDLISIIKLQYGAALEMLNSAVIECPDDTWDDTKYKNPFWHIAYHTLFYTHLYLHPREEDFVPWEKHRNESQHLGPLPYPPHDTPEIFEQYTKEDILTYLDLCVDQVGAKRPDLDLNTQSGFAWLPFGKLELQFYNIRHIQHHAGQLIDRLGAQGLSINWVGTTPRKPHA